MSSGKRLPPSRFPLPMRLAAAVPLGTLVAGSGLVGLPAPAAASPDPAAPVLAFTPASGEVEPGETVTTTLNIASGQAEGTVCLYDLSVDGPFEPGAIRATPPTTVKVSWKPEVSADIHASVAYAEVEGNECPETTEELTTARTTTPFTVKVLDPEPSPSPDPSETPDPSPDPSETPDPSPDPSETPDPSPDPSETPDPSPDPSETPDPSPDPSETPDPSPDPTTSPTATPDPTDSQSTDPSATKEPPEGGDQESEGTGGGSGGSGGGSGDGSGGGSGSGSGSGSGDGGGPRGATAPPHSPVTTDDGSGLGADGLADIPGLPSGGDEPDALEPDSPSSGDGGLADLPSLEPGEDDASRTTQVAARQDAPTSMVTPAVLVLFLMLLLLFSMPLAPSRRVRIGPTSYKGRRRRH